MTEVSIIKELLTVAPVVGVLGWWVSSLKNQLKQEREENKEITQDYKKMAEKSIEVLTLADDKLKKNEFSGERINDIHRIVNELSELVKAHLIKV